MSAMGVAGNIAFHGGIVRGREGGGMRVYVGPLWEVIIQLTGVNAMNE